MHVDCVLKSLQCQIEKVEKSSFFSSLSLSKCCFPSENNFFKSPSKVACHVDVQDMVPADLEKFFM
jgi:hypothetical protein